MANSNWNNIVKKMFEHGQNVKGQMKKTWLRFHFMNVVFLVGFLVNKEISLDLDMQYRVKVSMKDMW
jgi:hypothetical protein